MPVTVPPRGALTSPARSRPVGARDGPRTSTSDSVTYAAVPGRDAGARGEVELAEHVADVVLDGALREGQPAGDRGVAQAFGDQGRDLGLAPGERAVVRRRPAAASSGAIPSRVGQGAGPGGRRGVAERTELGEDERLARRRRASPRTRAARPQVRAREVAVAVRRRQPAEREVDRAVVRRRGQADGVQPGVRRELVVDHPRRLGVPQPGADLGVARPPRSPTPGARSGKRRTCGASARHSSSASSRRPPALSITQTQPPAR